MSHNFSFLCFAIVFFSDGAYLSRWEEGSATMEEIARELLLRQGITVTPTEFNSLVNALILFFEGSESYRIHVEKPSPAALKVFEAERELVAAMILPEEQLSTEELRRLKKLYLGLYKAGRELSEPERQSLLERASEISAVLERKELAFA